MPASTRKFLIAIAAPAAGVLSASTETYLGTVRSIAALTGAFSTLTTAAIVASKMPLGGFLATAANIEVVGYSTTGGTTGVLTIRTVTQVLASTLTNITMNVGGTIYTATVTPLNAFVDQGLTQDAEIAAMTNFGSSLAAALV